MPSSTFNSNTGNSKMGGYSGGRIDKPELGLSLIIALMLAIVGIFSLEVFFRSQNHLPSVVDDYEYWSYFRSKVYNKNCKTVVLVGSSQIQFSFSTKTYRELYPKHCLINLSVEGHFPIAIFKDLAKDKNFNGTIFLETTEFGLDKKEWDSAKGYLDYYYNKRNLNKLANRLIGANIESKLITRNPSVSLQKTVYELLSERRLPKPIHVRTFKDRSRSADYTKVDAARYKKIRVQRREERNKGIEKPSDKNWLKNLQELEPVIKSLKSRGGDVIFIRFPHTGKSFELDNQIFPKEKFWDKFAKNTLAKTLHFKDHPKLEKFKHPDTVHVDASESEAFTKEMLNILKQLLPFR